jgi:hypothetical protein
MGSQCAAGAARCGAPATRAIALARECGHADPNVIPVIDACDEHFGGRAERPSFCAECGEKTYVIGTVTVR